MPFQLALFDNPCPEKVRNSTVPIPPSIPTIATGPNPQGQPKISSMSSELVPKLTGLD